MGGGSSSTVATADNTLTVLGTAAADLDGDGLTNGAEIALGTDPTKSDTDGDGLPDQFEVSVGLDPNDSADAFVDTDGDGISNLVEFQRGTDPLNPDTAPPAVAQTYPVDGFVDFQTNGRMVIRFTEPLRPDSVVIGAVRLFQNTLAVAGEVNLSNDGLSITFKPFEALSAFATYTLEIQGVRDVAGNPLNGIFRSTFTTSAFIDNVPPEVLSTSIANGQTGVPVNAPFTVRFSAPMDPATLDDSSFRIQDNANYLDLPGMVQVDPDGMTVSFVPEQPLPVGRYITVFLDAGRISDTNGNRLHSALTYGFSTGFDTDTAPPTLRGVSPEDGWTDVPKNARIELQFSEPLNLIDIQNAISLQTVAGNMPGSIALSDGNRRLTFTPSATLAPASLHTLTISAQVTDIAGNVLAGPLSTTFTTGNVTDVTGPTLTQVNVADGAVDVSVNVAVRVGFSEVMNALSVNPQTFFLDDAASGVPVPGTVSVATDGLSATFTPIQPPAALTSYRVRTLGITDLAGNNYSGIGIPATFMTGAAGADSTAPTVAQNSLSGAVQAPVNARLVVQFSETIDPFSVSAGSVRLSAGGVAVVGALTLSADRRGLTFVPDSPLAVGTNYDFSINGLKDLGGNTLTPYVGSFSTSLSSEADTMGPMVTGMNPVSGSTAVAVRTPITVVFSEAVDPTSVDLASLPVAVDGFGGSVAADYTVSGNQVSITPLSPLPGNARIRVAVVGGSVRDLAGNANSAFQGFFDTGAAQDTTPPTVLLMTPGDGSVDVGLNAAVALTFSESLDATTITGNNFILFADGQLLSSSISRSSDNRTVTMSAILPADRLIQVAVSSAVRDLSGNVLADFVGAFHTRSALGGDRPYVIVQRPGNGANDVPLGQTVACWPTRRWIRPACRAHSTSRRTASWSVAVSR